jgi:release factor glutamine methyltransferase
MTAMTVGALLARAREMGLPLLEARMLLTHVTGLSRTRQMAEPDAQVPDEQASLITHLFQRRDAGEPVAYLIGEREFYGLMFAVSPAVLIPRPETELLVDLALARLPVDQPARALDLGTGSGAIPVSIRLHRPLLTMDAVDISDAALDVAQRNAFRHAMPVRFIHSDWYAALGDQRYQLIVSNPPYIAEGDPHLAEGDLRYEPRGALTDGSDGLTHLRCIVDGAAAHLSPGGWLLFEHGYDQAAPSRALLEAAGFAEVQSWQDLAGIARVSGGQLPPR